MRDRQGSGPMRPPGGASQGTGPMWQGTGPMREDLGPRGGRGGRGRAEFQPERFSSPDETGGGYNGGDSWGGGLDDDPGASFVPGLGRQRGSFTGSGPFADRDEFDSAGGFDNAGEFDSAGEFKGAAWPGDSYDDGNDAPRSRRGRNPRRGAGNSGPGDYDDYDSRDSNPVPRRKRGPFRRLAPWIALVVILAPIIGGGIWAYTIYSDKYHPADYSGPGTGPAVTVQIKQGDTASGIAPMLAQIGVVKSSRAFVLAAEHSTSTASLEPGTYRLDRHMQASLAYAALLNPKNRVQVTLAIPEGQRAAQIIATLAKDMNVPVATLQNILDHPGQLGLPSYAKGKPEGYLWPATYEIQPKETPLAVLQSMVAKFSQVSAQENLPGGATSRGLSMEQVMIEASMVQAEAGSAADMPKIARVIINRFNANMPLQFDSVLEYGLNKFAVNIQNSWASIPGPYNDFQNKGLPPTPICSPGLEAIDAVLHPASGNWLYFLAYPNGKSVFSATPLNGMS